jgi:hypothetical protein
MRKVGFALETEYVPVAVEVHLSSLSGEAAGRNLLSELHPKASEEQMTQQDDKKPLAP